MSSSPGDREIGSFIDLAMLLFLMHNSITVLSLYVMGIGTRVTVYHEKALCPYVIRGYGEKMIIKNNRQMIRAVRALRNINPIGIEFSYVDMLAYGEEYDYDNVSMTYAMESLIRSGEIVRRENMIFVRVFGDERARDEYFNNIRNQSIKDTNATESIF